MRGGAVTMVDGTSGAERGSVVVIGNFDGVHRGHQAVLAAVRRIAAERGLTPRLLTFEPHPAVTLGRPAPARLTALARKRALAARHCPGIDVVVRAFTPELASLAPEAFARDVLAGALAARVVMVGLNFRFGRGRSGGIDDLERFGRGLGFETVAEPLVADDHGACSSTRIRGLVAAGDLEAACVLLGRPHMVSGTVVAGERRGRTLGFPTANLDGVVEALPPLGVYAVLIDRASEGGGEARALGKGVANLGVRPTLATPSPTPVFEAHLFDFDDDLYGARVHAHLVTRLRDERRFASLEALRAQIAADSERARDELESWEPDPNAGGAWA
jgi:riboflavin kinase/FMN adenylyltransferase